jgi:hypothetical protein
LYTYLGMIYKIFWFTIKSTEPLIFKIKKNFFFCTNQYVINKKNPHFHLVTHFEIKYKLRLTQLPEQVPNFLGLPSVKLQERKQCCQLSGWAPVALHTWSANQQTTCLIQPRKVKRNSVQLSHIHNKTQDCFKHLFLIVSVIAAVGWHYVPIKLQLRMGPLSVPQMIHEWIRSNSGMILKGENRRTQIKTCISATLSTTNPTGLTWASAMKSQWLTTWPMAWPYFFFLLYNFTNTVEKESEELTPLKPKLAIKHNPE